VTLVPVEIAGARLDLCVDGSPPARLGERYGAFAAAASPGGWRFELRPGPTPPFAGMTGRVVAQGDRLVVEGAAPLGHLDLAARRAVALADPTLVIADALVRAALAADVLARGGCLLHAAALVVDGAAHLCPGRSGAGKSTLAGLAGDVLSDELVAVLPDGSGFRAHGTPWWTGRPGSAPLGAVHVLAWDGEETTPLPRGRALRHLAANLVLPLDRPAERAAAFAAAGRIAGAAPLTRLAFRTTSDVDALLRRRSRAA
jgi:hypothetical protein